MLNVDVCIIGAGPAGITAAIDCTKMGSKVVLLDEQPSAGGQIYRSIKKNGHVHGEILGPDYLHGAKLVSEVESIGVQHITEAKVWRVDKDKKVFWSCRGKAQQLQAKRIIIATGALERSFAFPGWTLPGAMMAGASQVLLKTSGLVPKQAVMVGTGPLLYLLAVQLIKTGNAPIAIVDTQAPKQYIKASRYWANAIKGRKYIYKGINLLLQIKKAGVKHYHRATDICAYGVDKVEGLSFTCAGKNVVLDAQTILSHIGVVPNVQLTRALELDHSWDPLQRCWRPSLDEHHNTSLSGVAVAGDNSGIGGALVAEYQGHLVACEALYSLGKITKDEWQKNTKTLKQQIKQELVIRPFLDALYSPPQQALTPADKTIICRCEEVSAGDIRQYARHSAYGINQIKSFSRCGMGPCQGRYCGQTAAEIIANEANIEVSKVGYFRIRYPIKPLKLGELASLTPIDKSFMPQYKDRGQ